VVGRRRPAHTQQPTPTHPNPQSPIHINLKYIL